MEVRRTSSIYIYLHVCQLTLHKKVPILVAQPTEPVMHALFLIDTSVDSQHLFFGISALAFREESDFLSLR